MRMRTSLFPTSYVTSHISECWNFYKKMGYNKKEKFAKNHVSRFKNLSYFLLSPEAAPYGADLWSVTLLIKLLRGAQCSDIEVSP